jgi:large subunit ribosomal protein L10
MNRTEKEATVAELSASLAGTTHAFLLDFKGMKVVDVTDLRAKIRKTGSSCSVVKNTLAKRAVAGSPLEALAKEFVGPTAIAWNPKDPVALAKVLADAAKGNAKLKFKAAIVEGQAIPISEITQVAEMPSREQLIAKLLFVLQSPMRNLVTVLSAPQRGLVTSLAQVAKQKEEAGA